MKLLHFGHRQRAGQRGHRTTDTASTIEAVHTPAEVTVNISGAAGQAHPRLKNRPYETRWRTDSHVTVAKRFFCTMFAIVFKLATARIFFLLSFSVQR